MVQGKVFAVSVFLLFVFSLGCVDPRAGFPVQEPQLDFNDDEFNAKYYKEIKEYNDYVGRQKQLQDTNNMPSVSPEQSPAGTGYEFPELPSAQPEPSPELRRVVEPVYESTLHKVKGASNGEVPYAPINPFGVVSRTIDSRGGSVEADLAKGVKMYVVLPEGEVIQSAVVTIMPYTSMPSSPDHPGLSDDYGYGAHVAISSVQMGITGFIVFDTEGGNARKRVYDSGGVFNRCDPKMRWFNPFICAMENRADLKTGVVKGNAIVSPIFYPRDNSIVMVRNTIPLGINGLIAAEFKGSDVFVPQKVDQALAAGLANAGIGNFSNGPELVEAFNLARAWNVRLSPSQLENVAYAVENSRTFEGQVEAYFAAKDISAVANERKASAAGEDEKEELDNLARDAEESMGSIASNIFSDSESDSYSCDADYCQNAAAAVAEMKSHSVQGADAAFSSVYHNLSQNIFEGTKSLDSANEAVNSAEAVYQLAVLGVAQGRLSGEYAGGAPPIAAYFDAGEIDLESLRGPMTEVAQEIIDAPNSGIIDILKALQALQLLGFDTPDLEKQAFDKIREKIVDMLKNPNLTLGQLGEIGEISFKLGFDDLGNQALQRFPTASDLKCDALVKKTLKDYGLNECT
ncbi:Uncharacterised protein [uncultured archaeon]|nr:Uncharacterised protein [uncultured archaeon]